jgi:hypothetical protein
MVARTTSVENIRLLLDRIRYHNPA